MNDSTKSVSIVVICWYRRSSRQGSSPTNILPSLECLKHLQHCIWLIVLPIYSIKQVSCLLNLTHTCSSSSLIVTLSLTWQTACAHAHFSKYIMMTDAYTRTRKMAACCQDQSLDVLRRHTGLSVPIGALFKKFAHFLHTLCKWSIHKSLHQSLSYSKQFMWRSSLHIICSEYSIHRSLYAVKTWQIKNFKLVCNVLHTHLNNVTLTPKPSYSPDLAQWDFFFFLVSKTVKFIN